MPEWADHLRQRLAPLHFSPNVKRRSSKNSRSTSMKATRNCDLTPASLHQDSENGQTGAGEMGPRRQILRLTPRPASTAA